VILAFGCMELSTTTETSGYWPVGSFCHWMPAGGVIATPGAGLVLASVEAKFNGPAMASGRSTLYSASASSSWSCGSLTEVRALYAISQRE
jgi:hypothetical protein